MSFELWITIGSVIALLSLVISIPVMLVGFKYDEPVFGVSMCFLASVGVLFLWPLALAGGVGLLIAGYLNKRKNGEWFASGSRHW